MKTLLILHVTVEQETAVHHLFTSKSWNFCDLAKCLSETLKNNILSSAGWKLDNLLSDDISLVEPTDNKVGTRQGESDNLDEPTDTVVNNRYGKSDEQGICVGKDTSSPVYIGAGRATNKPDLSDSESPRKLLNIDDKEIHDLGSKPCDIQVKRVLRSRSRHIVHKQTSRETDAKISKENKSGLTNQKGGISSTKCRSTKTVIEKLSSDRRTRNPRIAGNGRTNVQVGILKDNVDIAEGNTCEREDADSNSGINEETGTGISEETGTGINEETSTGINEEIGTYSKETGSALVDTNSKQAGTCADKVNHIDNDIKEKYNCDKCNYVANIKSNLNRHIREIHSGVRFQCSKCDKSFKGKHDAKMHEICSHSGKLKCDQCNKTFSSVSGLRNHSKTVHKKKALYRCQYCKRTFFYKSHYLGHVNKHLGVKPFTCEKCKKPFRYKVACKLHERTCNNESFFETHHTDGSKKAAVKKKFLCDICGASGLNSKSSLKMHHFYAHSDRSQCVCSLCGKTLKGIYSLRRHMKTQHEDDGTRYTCSVCDRSFNQLQIYKQHMKIHNKQYTCFCDTCGKGFLTKFKMKEHARIHTGEKPFVCSICHTYKSATKTNLQKHMKVHDKEQLPKQPGKKAKNTANVIKNANHVSNITSQAICDTVRHPTPVYLQSMNGNFSRSNVFTEGQRQYTTLPGMPMENSPSRFPSSNYSQMYNMVEDEGQHVSRSQGHDADYDVGNSAGYYGNESGNESTDLSQGLNILTIAMNIVNPEQY